MFWEVEEFNSSSHLSSDDAECEIYIKETVCRNSNGRFMVKVPFKYSVSNLVDSRP